MLLLNLILLPTDFCPQTTALSVWTTDDLGDFNGTGHSMGLTQFNSSGGIQLSTGYGSWRNKNPSLSPPAREAHSMATIEGTDCVLLFGGYASNSVFNDTWIYNLSDNFWSLVLPSSQPPARLYSAMGAVRNDDKVVLFGGQARMNGNQYFSDTWVFDMSDGQWTLMHPPINPSPRSGHAMTMESMDNKIVLFGGFNGISYLNDTWVYDINLDNWVQQFPQNHPSGLSHAGMAPVYNDDKIVLFGGSSGGTPKEDTWVYNLSINTWDKKYFDTSFTPGMTNSPSMTMVYKDDTVILVKAMGTGEYTEAWAYDIAKNSWSQKDRFMPGRSNPAIASAFNADKCILFGGSDYYGWLNDTWVFGLAGYPANGYYESPYFDAYGNSSFWNLSWNAWNPPGTSISYQIRTASDLNYLLAEDFTGPDGTTGTFYTTNSTIWEGHGGTSCIQYKAYLFTADIDLTPVLLSVSVDYNRFPEVPHSLLPIDSLWFGQNRLNFSWEYSDYEPGTQMGYEWQMDNQCGFNSPYFQTVMRETDKMTYTNDVPIPDGGWYWRIRTKDMDGGWSPFSSPQRLGIDTIPPEEFTPVSEPPGWTNGSCRVIFSANDISSGIERYEAVIDGSSQGCQTSPFTLPALTDGQHNITIKAYDYAGNFAQGSVKIFIDRTPPESFCLTAIPSSCTNNTLQLLFSTIDDLSGLDHYDIWVDSIDCPSKTSPYTVPMLDNGIHIVRVLAYDRAGNVRESSLEVLIDRTSPQPVIITANRSGWTNQIPSLTFFSSDLESGIDHFDVSVGDVLFTKQISPFVPPILKEGINPVTIRAVDRCGNVAEGRLEVLFDSSPPISFVPVAEPSNWSNRLPLIYFATTDAISGIDYYEISVNGSNFIVEPSPYIPMNISDGETNIIVRAYDLADNYIAENVSIYVDSGSPSIVSFKINRGARSSSGQRVTLSICATDAFSGLGQMCFSNDGTHFSGWELYANRKDWTLTPGAGEKIIYLKVRDKAGNVEKLVSAKIILEPSIMTVAIFPIFIIALLLELIFGIYIFKKYIYK
jgi:N-acetylneuraminic acid mutarotase